MWDWSYSIRVPVVYLRPVNVLFPTFSELYCYIFMKQIWLSECRIGRNVLLNGLILELIISDVCCIQIWSIVFGCIVFCCASDMTISYIYKSGCLSRLKSIDIVSFVSQPSVYEITRVSKPDWLIVQNYCLVLLKKIYCQFTNTHTCHILHQVPSFWLF